MKYTTINLTFAALLYFGYFQEVEGAQNIFSVFTYITFGLTLSLFHRDVAKKAFEHNKTNNFNIRFGRVRDIAFVACLAWTGQFWYAAIWAFHLVSIFVATNLDLDSEISK